MNNKKILIIFNPKAGKKYRLNYREKILQQLHRYLPNAACDWLETGLNLNQQLKDSNLGRYDKIIVIGGDGTIKKTVDFILTNSLNIPLAIIPQGSANILAGSLNIPLKEKAAVKIAALGKEKIIDVGLVNQEHYFLVGLSVGLISRAVLGAKSKLKNRWGIFAYLLALLKQPKPKQELFDFQIDNQDFHLTGNTLMITNTFSLFKIKPRHWSDYADGLLEIMVTRNKSILGFFPIFLSAWLKRGLIQGLFVKSGRSVKISEKSLADKTIQLDGEPLEVKKIKATILPQKLKVITK